MSGSRQFERTSRSPGVSYRRQHITRTTADRTEWHRRPQARRFSQPCSLEPASRKPFPLSTRRHPSPATPYTAWKAKGAKSPADTGPAKIELLEYIVPVAELEMIAARHGRPEQAQNNNNNNNKVISETWICCCSLHRDATAKDTASWAEFRACLKDRHTETEDAFTPSVVGARAALVWDAAAAVPPVEEMCHHVGRPLQDRTFPVLQMTCAAVVVLEEEGGPKAKEDSAVAAPAEGNKPENGHGPPSEFLVVSIKVSDFAQASPYAELWRARGVVVAAYASVERLRKLPGWDGEIEWLMATASDTRSVLPMWVQTLAVPGQIAKDAGLFLSWLARERTGENQPSSTSEAPLPPPPVAAASFRYRAGSVLYAILHLRPGAAHIVSRLAQFIANPSKTHLAAANHCIQYLDKSRDRYEVDTLEVFMDVSFADRRPDRRSFQGFLIKLFGTPIA